MSRLPSISVRFVSLCLFLAFAVFACLVVEEDLAGALGVAGGVVSVFITGQAMRPSGRPFPFGACGRSSESRPAEGSSSRIEAEG